MFAVGTERDHVAPWRSVYKLHLLTDTEVTFVLTSGGHNAGIVSEPGHAGRHYRVATKAARRHRTSIRTSGWPTRRCATGSWWPEWTQWLARTPARRSRRRRWAAAGYAPLGDAPGTYVLQP